MDEKLQNIIDQVYTKVVKQLSGDFNQPKAFADTISPTISDTRSREITKSSLAKYIDHTLLKPEATEQQIIKLCEEAATFHFASVCVNPCWVKLCSEKLVGTDVMVCTVAGFPLGANTTCLKVDEAVRAVQDGAQEIDMVLNIGRLKSGYLDKIYDEVHRVVEAVRPAQVKVIIETCLLTEEEKITACVIAREAGAHFVKTSTGFNKAGATVQDVALMRQVVGDTMGVKAAGGIRDYETAVAMIKAGANRIGASSSVAIVS